MFTSLPAFLSPKFPLQDVRLFLNHNTANTDQTQIGIFSGSSCFLEVEGGPGDRRDNGYRNNDNGGEAEEAKGHQPATGERTIYQMLLRHSQLSNPRVSGHRIFEAQERSEPQ